MKLGLKLAAGKMEMLRQIGYGVGGIVFVQVIAYQALPAFFRQQSHGRFFIRNSMHIRMGKVGVVIIAGRPLVALMGQARLQKEEVTGC